MDNLNGWSRIRRDIVLVYFAIMWLDKFESDKNTLSFFYVY